MKRDVNLNQQVFLLDKDAGTLCRILGLYAARGIVVDSVNYEHAAPRTMLLTVTSTADEECLRILVDKAASLVGVAEAASRVGLR